MWPARSLGKAVCVHAMFTGHAQKQPLPVVFADGLGRGDPLQTEQGGSCWRKTGPGLRSRPQGPGPCSVPGHLVPRVQGPGARTPCFPSGRRGRGNYKLAPLRASLGHLTTSQMAEAMHIWGTGEYLRAVQ